MRGPAAADLRRQQGRVVLAAGKRGGPAADERHPLPAHHQENQGQGLQNLLLPQETSWPPPH